MTPIRPDAKESRELGINLRFVIDVFPQEAQEKAEQLVKELLPKKTQLSADEQQLLHRYSTPKGWTSAIWLNQHELKVEDMTFIELSKIVAYGDVAYGKGLQCPRDGMPNCSIVDAVYPKGYSQKATLFLSWVWGYKFATALSALKNYSATHEDMRVEECFIWWCFFQNNQWRMLGDSGEKQSFDSLRAVFGTQLRNVGRMVSMLDQIEDSRYSKRLWCLFEVHVATEAEIPMEVMLPYEAEGEMEALIARGGFKKVKAAVQVDSEKATASVPEDQEGIRALIETMDGSYDTLNLVVRDSLKKSLHKQFIQALGSFDVRSTATTRRGTLATHATMATVATEDPVIDI
jgi:hypothetical protein